MSRVVIVHRNRDASPLVAALSKARYEVDPLSPQGMPGLRGVRDDPPDAFAIDLERRPSRACASRVGARTQLASNTMAEPGQPLERELEEIGAQLAWVRDYL